nr:ATP-binding cassette domain-containing protein [Cumulibacter soli]
MPHANAGTTRHGRIDGSLLEAADRNRGRVTTNAVARPVLESVAVSRVFRSRGKPPVVALNNVDVQLHPGRTLGLVGESGSGKTTLSRLLLGLDSPTEGEIRYRGTDLAELDKAGRRRYVRSLSAVFQNPYSSLSPRMRLWAIVTEQDAIDGKADKSQRRARAAELLELVGLQADYRDRYPHQLSGGQRQRVAIARALSQSPELIVLDEPMSALDVSVSAQVVNLLLDLQRTLNIAYLFVAHDMHLVRHLSHDVAVLYKGELVESGVAADVWEKPKHDYTKALIAASELEHL